MSGTVQSALAAAAARLAGAGVREAAADARRLMAGALGAPAQRITPMAPEPMPAAARAIFDAHVAARLAGRPVSQILGRREFWGRSFIVTADVLDPRPETETLVALAFEGTPPRRLLDLGTGSGAILVTLLAEWPEARGWGTDVSDTALAVAARNAARHGVAARTALRRADWFDGVGGPFDLIVSNPPYIPAGEIATLAREVRDWEPHLALTPGPRGVESHERIAAGLAGALAPGGLALFEIGAGQGAEVAALYRTSGFADVTLHPDLDGRDRVVQVRHGAAATQAGRDDWPNVEPR